MWNNAKDWLEDRDLNFSFTPTIGSIETEIKKKWESARTWWDKKKTKAKTYTPEIGSIYEKMKSRWDSARTWWNSKKTKAKEYTPSIGSIYDKVYTRWKNARDWWNKKKGSFSTYTPSIGSLTDKLKNAWNSAKKWWSKNVKLDTKLNVKVPTIKVKWETASAFGKSFKYPTGFSLKFAANEEGEKAYAEVDAAFAAEYPQGYSAAHLNYPTDNHDELALLNYTSGSTGNPKGVMLTNRNLTANIYLIPRHFPYRREDNYVSVLPFAHIFGMVYDMLAPLCFGMHLIVLGLPPVPSYLKPALREFKPHVFFAVPLILTKLIEDTIGEFIHSKSGEAKLADYQNNPDFCEALATIFMKALGGNIGIFALFALLVHF